MNHFFTIWLYFTCVKRVLSLQAECRHESYTECSTSATCWSATPARQGVCASTLCDRSDDDVQKWYDLLDPSRNAVQAPLSQELQQEGMGHAVPVFDINRSKMSTQYLRRLQSRWLHCFPSPHVCTLPRSSAPGYRMLMQLLRRGSSRKVSASGRRCVNIWAYSPVRNNVTAEVLYSLMAIVVQFSRREQAM